MKWLFPLISMSAPLHAAAEKKPPEGVEIALISDHASIARGGTFRVGFKIHHQAGYHTYWQNPGIAGVATTLAWQLPKGFTAGPIGWPYPEKTKMAGYSIYGYERDVLLVTEITAPAELTGANVTLKLEAAWMACAKGCSPGREKLEISLPVTDQAVTDPSTASIFTKALAEIPSSLDTWNTKLLTVKDTKELKLQISPNSKPTSAPKEVYFFSSDGQISSEHPQPVTFRPDGGCEIVLTRAEQSAIGKSSLPGVLKITSTLSDQAPIYMNVDPVYPADGQ